MHAKELGSRTMYALHADETFMFPFRNIGMPRPARGIREAMNRSMAKKPLTVGGANVLCSISIGFTEAALGTNIAVRTVDGYESIQIPAGTQTGSIFRMRGKGLPASDGRNRGDQLVKVIVRTPTDLSERQRRLLTEFKDQEAHAHTIAASHNQQGQTAA